MGLRTLFECSQSATFTFGDCDKGIRTFGHNSEGKQTMKCDTNTSTVRYCTDCCECGPGPELTGSVIEELMNTVPDNEHVWWVIGADGLHVKMDSSCIHSWWNDKLLATLDLKQTLMRTNQKVSCCTIGIEEVEIFWSDTCQKTERGGDSEI